MRSGIETVGPGSPEDEGGKAYWDAQWRYRVRAGEGWRFKKQRLGLARLEPDGGVGWRKPRGRCREGWLDDRAAHLAGDRAMRDHAAALANEAELRRKEAQRAATVRAWPRTGCTGSIAFAARSPRRSSTTGPCCANPGRGISAVRAPAAD